MLRKLPGNLQWLWDWMDGLSRMSWPKCHQRVKAGTTCVVCEHYRVHVISLAPALLGSSCTPCTGCACVNLYGEGPLCSAPYSVLGRCLNCHNKRDGNGPGPILAAEQAVQHAGMEGAAMGMVSVMRRSVACVPN